MTIRILHVGVGIRGRHWLDIVRDYPDAVSAGCVDPLKESLEQVAEKHSALPLFSDLEEGLKSVEADAAIIASHAPMHMDNALRCLEAGLAVLVEKPFAPTVREAWEVIELGEKLDKATIAAQNYRFNPAERTLRSLVRQGRLGAVTNVECRARRFRAGRGTFLASLEYPQLIDDGVHHFDSIRSILGCNPVSVTARSFNPPWSEYRHGAVTEALIEMEKGVHVQYLGSIVSHRYGWSLRIEGEEGECWTNRQWVLWRKKGKRLFRPVKKVPVPEGDGASYPREGSTSLLNSLRDAVRGKKEPETSGRDNLWTLAIVEAGMRSDRERREVRVEEVMRKGS